MDGSVGWQEGLRHRARRLLRDGAALVETPSLRRALEPVTSESARIANLGPALFFVIVIGIIVIALCSFSTFIDKPGPRRGMRTAAFVLILVPTLFFSATTYVSDTSQIVTERKVDETSTPRVLVTLALVVFFVLSIVSLFTGRDSPLTMHRQGRNVYAATSSSAL